MTAPVSTATDLAFGIQTVKGTPITANLMVPRLKESAMLPVFDEANPGPEHGIANSTRPTLVKSSTRRTGYMGQVAGSGFLYPYIFQYLLAGMGFVDDYTDNTTYDTHVWTIGTRSDAAYLTTYYSVDEGAAQFEHRAVDTRISQASLLGNIRGTVVNFQGISLDVENAAGTETFVDEVDEMIVATDGSITANAYGATLVSTIRGLSLSIENPIYTDEHRLFNPERADLPQLGIGISGVLTGVDVTTALWDDMFRNNTSSGSPSLLIPEMDLTFTFESVQNISGASVPYSITFDMPTCSARMTGYGSSGRDLIRTGISFVMKDLASGTEPITITVNDNHSGSYHAAS